tara:strand:+ start:5029 stop:5325 length:297 start_codon:yes stop_codon:yes gene_type:complete
MPLNKPQLAAGLKKAFDDGHKIVKKDPNADMNWEIAKRMADSIDKYVRGGDVIVDTDTPNLKIQGGIKCMVTAYVGNTLSLGEPVPQTTRGNGKGKVV